MIPVDSYGLHWDGAVGWLVQGRSATNFVGLAKKSPFIQPKGMCNHLLPVAAPIPDKLHWASFQKIMRDPLVQAMLPIPREAGDRAFYVTDPYDDLSLYLACLTRLSSPITSAIRPAWMVKASELEREMMATNIQPWVITQVTTKEQGLVNAVSKSTNYLPRTVVMSGKDDVIVSSPMKRIQTEIREFSIEDLVTLPLEVIGATVLRRFVRKEDISAPIESRQDRRDRIIKDRH